MFPMVDWRDYEVHTILQHKQSQARHVIRAEKTPEGLPRLATWFLARRVKAAIKICRECVTALRQIIL